MSIPELIAATVMVVAYFAAPAAILRTKHGQADMMAFFSLGVGGFVLIMALGALAVEG